MSTQSATRLYSAEEFYQLPDAPHGGKMELIRGEVITHMPVGGEHSYIAGRALIAFGIFVEQHELGAVGVECGFRLCTAPDTVRAPDVHFVRTDRLPGGRMPRGFFPGVPDLAVEVVSPEDTPKDVRDKVDEFLAAGTPRVWVIHPARRTVTVYRPGGTPSVRAGTDTLTSEDAGFEVQGFSLSLSDLFA